MQKTFDARLKELLEPVRAPGAPFTVLVAVSGGVDSMCMASLFLNTSTDVRMAIAHCNFGLRGEESDGDEALVEKWADDNHIPFHKAGFNTTAYASDRGISIEMAARELRYAWFAQLCEENEYDAVAVAHNANDNAETLILNLLRGTGSRGMSGMMPGGVLPVEGSRIPLIRPMLGFTRYEIESYADHNYIKYRFDSTNADNAYKRNRIRNDVFPVFRELNPSFVRTLNQDMSNIAEVNAIADEYYLARKSEVFDGRRIDTDKLKTLPHWQYILYRIMEEMGFNSSQAGDAVDALNSVTPGGKTFSAGDLNIITSSRGMVIGRSADTDNGSVPVECPGIYTCGDVRFSVEQRPYTPDMPLKQPDGTIIMDARALPFPFVARNWLPGDWMRPLGLHGSKKLSDLFVDLKFDLLQKSSAVVLLPRRSNEDNPADHVVALLGHRIDEAVKVTSATTSVIVVKILI